MREVLQSKHPPGQLAATDATLPGVPPEIHPVVFDSIDTRLVYAQLHYIAKVPQGPLAWMPMPGADCALLSSHFLPHSVSHLRMLPNASVLRISIPQLSPPSRLAG